MVGETNSVVGHHLLAGGDLIQLGGGGGGCCSPPPSISPPDPRQCSDNNNNNNNNFGVPNKITINLSLKFLRKWFLNKKQCVYQIYDMKHLNAASKLVVKKKQPSK